MQIHHSLWLSTFDVYNRAAWTVVVVTSNWQRKLTFAPTLLPCYMDNRTSGICMPFENEEKHHKYTPCSRLLSRARYREQGLEENGNAAYVIICIQLEFQEFRPGPFHSTNCQ